MMLILFSQQHLAFSYDSGGAESAIPHHDIANGCRPVIVLRAARIH